MKSIFTAFIMLLYLIPANLQSQTKIEHDKHYFWNKHHKWDNLNSSYYNFYNTGTKMCCITAHYEAETYYVGGEPVTINYPYIDIYHYNENDREFKYVKNIDNRDENQILVSTPVAFSYSGKNFIINFYYNNSSQKHYRKLYYTKSRSIEHWHSHDPLYSSEVSELKYYKAAFVSGSYLYLVYDSYYSYQNGSEEHHYHNKDIYIDVCKINVDNELIVTNTHHLSDVMAKNSYHPYELDGFIHPDGHVRLLISYSAEFNTDKENKGGGVIIFKPHDNNKRHLYRNNDYIFSIRAIHGSIKGKRTFDDLKYIEKENPNQIQVFYNHFEDHFWGPDDIGHYYYRTYAINNNYELLNHGLITHDDDDELPDEWNNMCLDATYRLIPVAHNDNDPANDSYEEKIYLFRTDKHNCIHADVFVSDHWKSNPSKSKSSFDLNDTSKYGQKVRRLWSLVGITEGAPPASINWEVWGNYHINETSPTTLTFTTASSSSASISYGMGKSFYTKTGAEIGNPEAGAIVDVGFKFTNAYKQETDVQTITKVSQTNNFGLNQNSQDSACLIWLIPDIYRIEYSIYPWWDDNLFEFPIENSESMTFYSPAGSLITENVTISDLPFNIEFPNNSDMADWKLGAPVRDTIQSNATIYNVIPQPVTWESPQNGHSMSMFQEKVVTSKQTHTLSFETEITMGYTEPEIFKVSATLNFEDDFTTTIEHQTSLSKDLKVSLENMSLESVGPQTSHLEIQSFFFEPTKDYNGDEVDWWYYEYFEDYKPWYITYIVTDSKAINISSPSTNDAFRDIPDISWENPNSGNYNYSVIFSHNSRFAPLETVEIKTDRSKSLKIQYDFLNDKLAKDSVIYYAIKGVDEKGHTVWSGKQWFIISDIIESRDPDNDYSLNFYTYPNPVSNGNINILFKTLLDNSKLTVRIFSIDNRLVESTEITYSKLNGRNHKISCDGLKPGIYILQITDGYRTGVQKIIVN
jgi:hypothetical protein